MMFKSVLLGILAVSAASLSADAATSSRTAATAPPVPLMWKVSDADNDLFLLGSFHMLKPGDYPLSADVDAAFDDAEALVFELSPQELQSPELGQAMGMAALRTDRTPLNSELPDATVAKLDAWLAANDKALQKMGMPAQAFQMFEPWFVGLTISLVEMDKQGLDPKIGLDMHFIGRAEKTSKPTTGLEKGSEQIAVFDGMSKTEQLQFLDESLNEAQNAKVEIEKLHAAWRRGDAAELLDEMAGDMRREYPQLYRKINVARNDAWVPKLQRMLDDEATDDILVVVGALHLLGEDGVVEKLRAKGYKVERVCSACANKDAAP
ncbi:MAG: TraB/GumN family protein [Lysobacteraceae bacterium]